MFRKDELTDGIAESQKQADNIITNMRQAGFIVSNGVKPPDNKMTYALNVMMDYSPDIIQEIQKLATSKYSTKDRRIGNLLISKLEIGYVDLMDYVALGEEIKWEPEMRFAEQLGVVTRESRTRFTINHELRRGYDKLDYWQKNMASELYDEFGDGSFTSSMIFAKLEYNKDRAIATLHTFSMMGILGTDLDTIDGKTITYQFRVTPAEHPECFEKAA